MAHQNPCNSRFRGYFFYAIEFYNNCDKKTGASPGKLLHLFYNSYWTRGHLNHFSADTAEKRTPERSQPPAADDN